MDLAELATSAGALARRAFVARHPHCMLISIGVDDEESGRSGVSFVTSDRLLVQSATPREATAIPEDETLSEGNESLLAACAAATPLHADRPPASRHPRSAFACLPIVKSTRNPFAQMVTVGRTPNNDVIVEDHTVSKFHAHFTREGAAWRLHDQGSTNGTFVARDRIDAKGVVLESGVRVAFGKRLRFRYYTPEGLHEVLGGSAGAKPAGSV